MYDIVFASKHDKNKQAFEVFKESYPNAKWLPNVTTLSQAISSSVKLSMTSMHWLITDDVIVHPDMDLTWKTETWDRPYVHTWTTINSAGNPVDEFAGVYLVPNKYKLSSEELSSGWPTKTKPMSGLQHMLAAYDIVHASYDQHRSIAEACQSLIASCQTEMIWLVMDDVILNPDWDISWRPPVWDRIYAHAWKTDTGHDGQSAIHTGVYLVPNNYVPTGEEIQQGSLGSVKQISTVASSAIPYDIFFMSYGESNADDNFRLLSDRFPRAQRVSGIKGIHNAHIRCAELSKTSMFWTVDADTVADAGFNFDYRPPDYDRQYLHLWHSRNPVNDLSYGWGSIKLWPTRLVREFRSNWLDFTTTVGNIKIIPDIVATSHYNCDDYSTWRSGFREAVKLCRNVNNGDLFESMERLIVWLTVSSSADFAEASRQGAIAGVEFYVQCKEDNKLEKLTKINDFDWLHNRFKDKKAAQSAPSRTDLWSMLRD